MARSALQKHLRGLYLGKFRDFDFEKRLAVAALFKIVAFCFIFDDDYFFSAINALYFSRDFGALDIWLANSCILAIVYQKDSVKDNQVARLSFFTFGPLDFLNFYGISLRHHILLPASLYDGKLSGAIDLFHRENITRIIQKDKPGSGGLLC